MPRRLKVFPFVWLLSFEAMPLLKGLPIHALDLMEDFGKDFSGGEDVAATHQATMPTFRLVNRLAHEHSGRWGGRTATLHHQLPHLTRTAKAKCQCLPIARLDCQISALSRFRLVPVGCDRRSFEKKQVKR
jgi:hypothetical protein